MFFCLGNMLILHGNLKLVIMNQKNTMRKLFALLVLILLSMSGIAQEPHFDFSIINSTGYEIFYRIINAENHWVEVTYPCQNGDNYWWGYDKPEGKLIFDDTISYQGTDYILVAIGDHAFCGCSGLRGTLEFPETIQSIGAGAFKGCPNFNGILTIPPRVTRIEDEAFCGCSGFGIRLYLSDSVTYIGARAFQQCSFRGMLMLPSTLTFIGDEAFKGCSHVNSISIKAVAPPTTAPNTFAEVPTWIPVAVPYTAKEAYKSAQGWSRFADRVVEKSYWNGKAVPWTKGNGTSDNPYLIESAENLAWLAKSVNERQDLVIDTIHIGGDYYCNYQFYDIDAYQDTCFRLVIDIDVMRYEGLYWNPIGNCQYINDDEYQGIISAPHHTSNASHCANYYITRFSGHFDGNNHVISKAHYESSFYVYDNDFGGDYSYCIGLFGIIHNATIQDLTLNSMRTTPYFDYTTGGLVGSAINSTIYNCHTSGTITNSSTGGGIVGFADRCRIERCTAQIDFVASRAGGGIAGTFVCDSANTSQNGVLNCSFIGNISDATSMGGIIALCQSVSEGTGTIHIENCFSRGNLTRMSQDPNDPMETGDRHVGGIVGEVANIDTLSIMNCYSHDTITNIGANLDNAMYYAGGILAYADVNTTLRIKNCYHVGPIATQHKGGIIGQNTHMTIIRNSFFEENCAPDDGFGVPMSSDYMKTEAFVSQLNNGSSVYQMDVEPYENNGYPIFGTDGLIFVGAEWYYEIHNNDGSITYQHLQCVGDTTINEERPKIIIRSNTHYDRDTLSEVTHEYVYEQNGVVYWWNKTMGKFTVLYDFGAEVGDEWTVEVGDTAFTTRVYAAELQYINGIPYKKVTIADPSNIFSGSLLSSIGHQTSFFPEKLMTRSKGYRVEGLRCYWLDDELIYKLGDEDCDAIYAELHNGIEEKTDDAAFTVYPNPAHNVLFVETRTIGSQPTTTYRITNLMGQTVLSGSITDDCQQINIEALSEGMYFITLGEMTQKFIVK